MQESGGGQRGGLVYPGERWIDSGRQKIWKDRERHGETETEKERNRGSRDTGRHRETGREIES